MKFKKSRKGIITFLFGICEGYQGIIGHCHTGIDYMLGFGLPHRADNSGYIYKAFPPGDLTDNWTGVYMLVEAEFGYMEVCMGHFSRIPDEVREGAYIQEDEIVGYEGNSGTVFSRGQIITPEMQRAGDTRGHHVHEQYRPVRPVDTTAEDKHYLRDRNGGLAKDPDGKFLEIIHTNDMNGCVDPMIWEAPSTADIIEQMAQTYEREKHKDSRFLWMLVKVLRAFNL